VAVPSKNIAAGILMKAQTGWSFQKPVLDRTLQYEAIEQVGAGFMPAFNNQNNFCLNLNAGIKPALPARLRADSQAERGLKSLSE